ncbi:MAG: hypothetical protein JOZ05_25270 [Acetobacteraceae bacterium]|nr:hypothetical protein [Acetobacteraceae bacterium]
MAVNKVSAAPEADAAESPKAAEPPLSVAELARGVLGRTLRPRIGDVRRLAEAVLAAEQGKGKKIKGKKKSGKKRKLAKIAGAKKPGK